MHTLDTWREKQAEKKIFESGQVIFRYFLVISPESIFFLPFFFCPCKNHHYCSRGHIFLLFLLSIHFSTKRILFLVSFSYCDINLRIYLFAHPVRVGLIEPETFRNWKISFDTFDVKENPLSLLVTAFWPAKINIKNMWIDHYHLKKKNKNRNCYRTLLEYRYLGIKDYLHSFCGTKLSSVKVQTSWLPSSFIYLALLCSHGG